MLEESNSTRKTSWKKRIKSLFTRKWFPIASIGILSAITRFFMFGYPMQFVFDEVYFINFVSGYFKGLYFFDIHPPLGKLMITFFGWVTGFNGFVMTNSIGEAFPDPSYLLLRLLPMIFGVLLPIVIYLFARKIGISKLSSYFIALTVIFENSLLVQSRFVFLDMFLLVFGFLGLFFYFKSKELTKALYYKILAGIFLILPFSIKWTGLTFLAIVLILEFIPIVRKYFAAVSWKEIRKDVWKTAVYFIFIPIVVYTIPFLFHFSLLYKSGSGDAFMSQQFQATLVKEIATTTTNIGGIPTSVGISSTTRLYDWNVAKMPTIIKFFELNEIMYKANSGMTATHSYSSKWYTWPLDIRGIYYWSGPEDRMIYLIGNPFIYWFATAFILFCLILNFRNRFKDKTANLLLLGYFINLLPFILIGRVMFLYHYFTALIFSILCLGYLIDKIQSQKKRVIIISLLLLTFICSFLYFSPLTYGMKNSNIFERFWFKSWR